MSEHGEIAYDLAKVSTLEKQRGQHEGQVGTRSMPHDNGKMLCQ